MSIFQHQLKLKRKKTQRRSQSNSSSSEYDFNKQEIEDQLYSSTHDDSVKKMPAARTSTAMRYIKLEEPSPYENN